MEPVLSVLFILVGLIMGLTVAYLVQNRDKSSAVSSNTQLIQGYEAKLRDQQQQHQREIERARKQSVARSRYTIKGLIAEQLVPLLKGFTYEPSDARFIGSPVDYVVFNGYTAMRDKGESSETLEVVILDIKQGGANLSANQRRLLRRLKRGVYALRSSAFLMLAP